MSLVLARPGTILESSKHIDPLLNEIMFKLGMISITFPFFFIIINMPAFGHLNSKYQLYSVAYFIISLLNIKTPHHP